MWVRWGRIKVGSLIIDLHDLQTQVHLIRDLIGSLIRTSRMSSPGKSFIKFFNKSDMTEQTLEMEAGVKGGTPSSLLQTTMAQTLGE